MSFPFLCFLLIHRIFLLNRISATIFFFTTDRRRIGNGCRHRHRTHHHPIQFVCHSIVVLSMLGCCRRKGEHKNNRSNEWRSLYFFFFGVQKKKFKYWRRITSFFFFFIGSPLQPSTDQPLCIRSRSMVSSYIKRILFFYFWLAQNQLRTFRSRHDTPSLYHHTADIAFRRTHQPNWTNPKKKWERRRKTTSSHSSSISLLLITPILILFSFSSLYTHSPTHHHPMRFFFLNILCMMIPVTSLSVSLFSFFLLYLSTVYSCVCVYLYIQYLDSVVGRWGNVAFFRRNWSWNGKRKIIKK